MSQNEATFVYVPEYKDGVNEERIRIGDALIKILQKQEGWSDYSMAMLFAEVGLYPDEDWRGNC